MSAGGPSGAERGGSIGTWTRRDRRGSGANDVGGENWQIVVSSEL